MLSELRTIFKKVEHRVIIDGFEVDVFIPELKIGIEYDGKFWHRNKQQQDLKKNDALRNKINLIRVRDKGLSRLTDVDINQTTTKITVDTIKSILQRILILRQIESTDVLNRIEAYLNTKNWIATEEFQKLYAEKNHIKLEESIDYLFPKISEEWHPTLNEPVLPEFFSPGSNKKVWWICSKDKKHQWETQINHRCLKNSGCPICSNKKIIESNSLSSLNPELAKEWHPTKNGKLTPNDVGVGSNKKIWWKCNKGEDHEWKTSVTHRSDRGNGCPICNNKKIILSNSLAVLNPELANEWHPEKNGALTPFDVGIGSNKSAWWKCPKGDDHVWKAIIVSRQRGSGCPICSNQKIVESNSLATTNPELALEWHPTKNGELTAYDVSIGSSKIVWWTNNYGHDWQEKIHQRVKRFQKQNDSDQISLF
jgi:very-short-patch-repair endonuclease